MKLSKILNVLRGFAPEDTALPGDPVGLQIAPREEAEVTRAAVCLDASPHAIDRAIEAGAQLLVAHHPLIYQPLKAIRPEIDPIARSVGEIFRGHLALYVMHTNWDRAAGGINDTLAHTLELQDIRPLGEDGEDALPRIGNLASPRPLADFAHLVETTLSCHGACRIRMNPEPTDRIISRVAVCGGAGAHLTPRAIAAGADAYVTSDIRHHEFVDATARGFALIDAGHGATENPGMRALTHRLDAALPDLRVTWAGDA